MVRFDDFACRCGCGFNVADQRVIDLVNDLQRVAPEIELTSGCRCLEHNRDVGGEDKSAHVRGLAADVACGGSGLRDVVLRKLMALGVRRIGIGKDFVHFDLDPDRTQWVVWGY